MIDILMSTYNGSRFLAEQLDSILGQTFAEFKLMIRDDGSVDDTRDILEQYAARDARVEITDDDDGNLGLRRSFMRLLELSDADYFMFADQDDVWLDDKIERSLNRISELKSKSSPETPLLVFTDLTVVDEALNPINDTFWKFQALDPDISRDWRDLLAQNVATGCTILGNAAARRASLPFALPAMMHDHWVAVNTARTGTVEYLAEPTVLYRQHSENAEGGHRFDAGYAAARTRAPGRRWRHYREAARFFGDVSAYGLMVRKARLNLARLRPSDGTPSKP